MSSYGAAANDSAHMRAWAKVGIGVLATIGVLYVGFAVLTSFVVGRTCTVYPVTTVPSPSGNWRAEQVQETCNDDNLPRTVVWLSTGKSVDVGGKRWSAFRAVSSRPTGPSGVYEPVRLQLVWLSESELQISYPRGTELQHSERTEDGLRVRYQELAAGAR
jgi:hypothetical protein